MDSDGELGRAYEQIDELQAERDELVAALREIATRLDSAAAEVDCFNVYESRDIARAALRHE
jgi:uncharacterized coiled-coil DUF342 family protein